MTHCGDFLLYLGHHKEPLRWANKEASLSQENEVIIVVRGCPEARMKKKKKERGWLKMKRQISGETEL